MLRQKGIELFERIRRIRKNAVLFPSDGLHIGHQRPLTAMVTTVRSAKAVITTFWRIFSCRVEVAAGGSIAPWMGFWGHGAQVAQLLSTPTPVSTPVFSLALVPEN